MPGLRVGDAEPEAMARGGGIEVRTWIYTGKSRCKAFWESNASFHFLGTIHSLSMKSLKRTVLDTLTYRPTDLSCWEGSQNLDTRFPRASACRQSFSLILCRDTEGLKLNYSPFSHGCSLIHLIPKSPENNLRLSHSCCYSVIGL